MVLKYPITCFFIAAFIIGPAAGKGSSSFPSSDSGSTSTSGAEDVRTWAADQKAAAAKLGTIFISSKHSTRYGAGRNWSDDGINVCQNGDIYPEYNATTPSGYGWFLCPTDGVQDTHKYCCGEVGKEFCCDFLQYKLTAVIFASSVVFAAIVVGFIMICISKATKRNVIRPSKLMKQTLPFDLQGSPDPGEPEAGPRNPKMGYPT